MRKHLSSTTHSGGEKLLSASLPAGEKMLSLATLPRGEKIGSTSQSPNEKTGGLVEPTEVGSKALKLIPKLEPV